MRRFNSASESESSVSRSKFIVLTTTVQMNCSLHDDVACVACVSGNMAKVSATTSVETGVAEGLGCLRILSCHKDVIVSTSQGRMTFGVETSALVVCVWLPPAKGWLVVGRVRVTLPQIRPLFMNTAFPAQCNSGHDGVRLSTLDAMSTTRL